ncbi:MAG: hypothetical protein ACI39R_00200 [Lachnospiraceae bacterium]
MSYKIIKKNNLSQQNEIAISTENIQESENQDKTEIIAPEDTISSDEEDIIMLSNKDISIICSCFIFLIFIVALIYALSHPFSITATVIMFLSLLTFIIIAMTGKE